MSEEGLDDGVELVEEGVGFFIPFEHFIAFVFAEGFGDTAGLGGDRVDGSSAGDLDAVLTNLAEADDFFHQLGVLLEEGDDVAG